MNEILFNFSKTHLFCIYVFTDLLTSDIIFLRLMLFINIKSKHYSRFLGIVVCYS